ncbi:MAG: S41 family peptidase [Candidatus Stahlbacteria bacterium]|nr:S41 family peptidase [Candidatus Stahlbacteria bacterium]
MKKKYIGIIGIVVIAGGILISATINIRQSIQTFSTVFNTVLRNYVQEVSPSDLIQYAINGMLQRLDPHTVYLDTTSYKELKIHTSGEYGGLGFMVGKLKNVITIMETFEGTPAYRAGLQAGDEIIEIDSISAKGISINEAVTKMRGTAGTSVILKVKKEGIKEPIDFHLTREKIKIRNVVYSGVISSNIGYIRIAQFSANTGGDVGRVLDSLVLQGANKFIIDLRGNPGGLLVEAINVSDHFLPKGKLIVSTKGRVPETNRDYYATVGSKIGTAPIIVLVNKYSASASEIVAGAIQDWDAGLIVGDTTIGKGSVQTLFPLESGAIKLTTATYHTPSGRCINQLDTTLFLFRNPSLGKKYTTLGPLKRELVAGGSIVPDVVCEPVVSLSPLLFNETKLPPPLLITVGGKGAFIHYASKYAREHPKLTHDFKIGNTILQDFKSYIRTQEIEFTDVQFDSVSQFVGEALKEAIFEAMWGTEGKYEAILAQDKWIRTSVDIISKANTSAELLKNEGIK